MLDDRCRSIVEQGLSREGLLWLCDLRRSLGQAHEPENDETKPKMKYTSSNKAPRWINHF